MRYVIKSKILNRTFEFWANDGKNGGYVYLESDGKPGTLGNQICAGGRFTGSTLSATNQTMPRVCRSWYRAFLRQEREFLA